MPIYSSASISQPRTAEGGRRRVWRLEE